MSINKDEKRQYSVTKFPGSKPNVEAIVNSITYYIQNNPIYFVQMPTFLHGVLCFSVMGIKEDHKKLNKKLGTTLHNLGCKLKEI